MIDERPTKHELLIRERVSKLNKKIKKELIEEKKEGIIAFENNIIRSMHWLMVLKEELEELKNG